MGGEEVTNDVGPAGSRTVGRPDVDEGDMPRGAQTISVKVAEYGVLMRIDIEPDAPTLILLGLFSFPAPRLKITGGIFEIYPVLRQFGPVKARQHEGSLQLRRTFQLSQGKRNIGSHIGTTVIQNNIHRAKPKLLGLNAEVAIRMF